MSKSISKNVVLIPAYNAQATIVSLIERLQKSLPLATVLVVDDGSTDATAQIAESMNAIVVRHQVNRGKGAALQMGFNYLLEKVDFENVLTMDADLQHMPEDAPSFYVHQQNTQADVVIGWRQRVGTGMPIHRVLSNTITSAMVGAKTGLKIQDSQCGFRLIQKAVLDDLRMESKGYEAETEFLIKAAKNGFTLSFVPIHTVYNNEKSHMQNWQTTINFVKVLLRNYT